MSRRRGHQHQNEQGIASAVAEPVLHPGGRDDELPFPEGFLRSHEREPAHALEHVVYLGPTLARVTS